MRMVHCVGLGLLVLMVHNWATTSSKPEKAVFICNSDARAISAAFFNDDFCDCADGSDEPQSSACSGHIMSSRFQCTNKGYEEQLVFFSRVGDSICDCCDGSDEAVGVCENTCAARAQQEKEAFVRRAAGWRKGLETRNQRLIQSQNLVTERTKKLASNRKRVASLESSLPTLEAAVAVEEQRERTERLASDQNLEDTLAATLRLSELPTNILSSDVVPHAALSCFESGVEAAIELAGEESAEVEDDVGLLLVGVNARGDNDMSQHKQHIEDGLRLQTVERDKLAEWAFKLADHCDKFELLATRVAEVWAIQSPNTVSQDDALASARAMQRRGQHQRAEATKARQVLEDAKKDLKEARTYIQDAEAEEKIDFGASNGFLPIKGTCVEAKHDKYQYKLCLFDELKQDSTLLGKWGEWQRHGDKLAWKFERGSPCPGGTPRDAIVNLECGPAEAIVSVSEPSRCSYVLQFETPCACGETHASTVGSTAS